MIDVSHDVVGRRFGVPIEASVDEFEVVLDASGSLELDLLDGDVQLHLAEVKAYRNGMVELRHEVRK